ncbi:MAG: glucose-1-phosphate cytidylyltransferase [bacterium]|nr:glucose-1-phosphate cytidylyltransferase [bacterium]
MKCVILAGGLGTRLSEETVVKPKPMVEIGGHPILWHIMKIYSHHGIKDFIICTGYKGYLIKEFFANYRLHMSDATFDMKNGEIKIHNNYAEPWKVTCVDTGDASMTGGRIKRIREYVENETFCLTYGDGVSDIDITKEVDFHVKNKNRATLAAVQPPGRWGHMKLDGYKIEKFEEKTQGDGGWINGGFFVLEPDIFDLIAGDSTIWEREPMEALAKNRQLSAWFHNGFWRPMDTLRDKMALEKMWQEGRAPWKVW